MSPKVTLLIVTDGRDYLEQTWESLQANVKWDWHEIVVVDDSRENDPIDDHHQFVQRMIQPDVHLRSKKKMDGGGAIRRAWSYLRHTDCDFVWHQEDDWTYPAPVDVSELIDIYNTPRVPHGGEGCAAKVTLRRQPWGTEGPGGFIGDSPSDHTEFYGNLINTRWFSLNPGIYPRWVTEYEWRGHEHNFSEMLASKGYHFAILGGRDDPPRVEHIGYHRSATYGWEAAV